MWTDSWQACNFSLRTCSLAGAAFEPPLRQFQDLMALWGPEFGNWVGAGEYMYIRTVRALAN